MDLSGHEGNIGDTSGKVIIFKNDTGKKDDTQGEFDRVAKSAVEKYTAKGYKEENIAKNDTALVLAALENAHHNRPDLYGCVHHTDADVRYCSDEYIMRAVPGPTCLPKNPPARKRSRRVLRQAGLLICIILIGLIHLLEE